MAHAFQGDAARGCLNVGRSFFQVQLRTKSCEAPSRILKPFRSSRYFEKHVLVYDETPGEYAPCRPAWVLLSFQSAGDRPRSLDFLGSNIMHHASASALTGISFQIRHATNRVSSQDCTWEVKLFSYNSLVPVNVLPLRHLLSGHHLDPKPDS